jgi:hypothetical protein
MCNSSSGDQRVYSLVACERGIACEPNAMLVLFVNQTKTINQFAKIVTVLGKKERKKRIFSSIFVSFFSP